MTSTPGSAPTVTPSDAEVVGRATWLVAQREVIQGLHSRAFRISVVLSMALVAVLGLLPALLDSDDDVPRYRVAVVDGADDLAGALAAVGRTAGLEVDVVVAPAARAELERALRDGGLDAAVVGGQVLADGTPPDRLVALLEGGNAIATQAERARRAGLTAEETAGLLAPTPPLAVVSVATDETEPAERGVAAVAVIGLFLALAFYGGAVMNGVLQEKSSRVVEVVLAAVSPRQLLTGKLAGIGLLGLGQVALIGLAALVSTQVAGTAELPSSTPATIGLAVLWFVLGYALYASLFAMAGSLISRQEDAQAAATPVTLLITGFYMVALLAVLPAPDGLVARICTFIPLAAPTTVLARVALGQIAVWEVVVSALGMVAAIVAVVGLAARVYAGAALHTGARLPWRTAFRAGGEPVTARPPAGSTVR